MKSMEDCSANEVDKQCSPKETRCGIFSAHREDTSYFRRDCISEEYCETLCKDGFNEEGGYACELHCCQGDFCNGEYYENNNHYDNDDDDSDDNNNDDRDDNDDDDDYDDDDDLNIKLRLL